MDLHPHDRLHYTGTNRGNVIFPVSLPSWTSENVWRLSVKVKRDVMGKNARISVGGPAPFEEGNKSNEKVRGATDVEAVFFHQLPRECDEEWQHSYDLVSAVSLSVGPGNDALVSVLNRRPYLGIVLTEKHATLLTESLVKHVWKALITEGSQGYAADLAAIVNDESPKDDDANAGAGNDGEAQGAGEGEQAGGAGAKRGRGKGQGGGRRGRPAGGSGRGGEGDVGEGAKKRNKTGGKEDAEMTKEQLLAKIAGLTNGGEETEEEEEERE